MEHDEVVGNVKNWLEKRYSFPTKVDESKVREIDLVALTVQYGGESPLVKYHLQVECKKTEDYVGPSVGICLYYYVKMDGLFTYLAIPEDYKQFQELQKIFRMVDLPIGLIVVHNNGKVEIVKNAEGKERTTQL